jgi:hypothetical protein
VVLEHVADHARALVETRPVAHATDSTHRDLDVVDGDGSERLEDAVGEAQDEDVLDGLLAQVVWSIR